MAEARQQTILLVDDDSDIVDALSRRLRAKGYQVLTALSGEDAIELLKKADIDLVLTDLRMPGEISGRELLVFIRTMGFRAPKVILMSGFHEELLQIDPPDQTIGKLSKPFQMQELLSLIHSDSSDSP